MRLAVAEKTVCLFVMTAGIAIVRMADASDCFSPFKTLEAAYAQADAVVLAKVSGCAGALPSDHGQCPAERYRLEVLETLKDSRASQAQVPSLDGSASIRIGNRMWPLYREAVQLQFGDSTSIEVFSEVTGGEPAADILEAMSEPTDIIVSAVRAGVGSDIVDEIPVEYRTRTTQFPAAAEKFEECIAAAGER